MKRWCSICRYLPALSDINLCQNCLDYELDQMRAGDEAQPTLRLGPWRLVERVDARSEFI